MSGYIDNETSPRGNPILRFIQETGRVRQMMKELLEGEALFFSPSISVFSSSGRKVNSPIIALSGGVSSPIMGVVGGACSSVNALI